MGQTNQTGDAGELFVAADLISNGYLISVPFGHDHPYDLLADKDGKILRVQVKTANTKKGVIAVKNTTTHTTGQGKIVHEQYKAGSYDLMAVFCPSTNKVYYINSVDLDGKTSLNLRVEPTKNNQSKKITWADDYTDIASVV